MVMMDAFLVVVCTAVVICFVGMCACFIGAWQFILGGLDVNDEKCNITVELTGGAIFFAIVMLLLCCVFLGGYCLVY